MCEFYLLYICCKRIRQLVLEFLETAWEDFDPFTGDSDTDDTGTDLDDSDNDCTISKTDNSPRFKAADFGGKKADEADVVK